MIEGFTRDGDDYVVTLGRSVCHQVVLLCDEVIDAVADASPVAQRLFPDASDVEEVALEFRRLTEADARQDKTDRLLWLQTVLADPAGAVRFPRPAAGRFVAAVNDLRLVLGELPGVIGESLVPAGETREPDSDHAPDPDPGLFARAVYDLLTWLQDSVIELMLADLAD